MMSSLFPGVLRLEHRRQTRWLESDQFGCRLPSADVAPYQRGHLTLGVNLEGNLPAGELV